MSSFQIEGEFTATGQSAEIYLTETKFNVSLWGFGVATITLERSFDDGVTWLTAKTFSEDFEGMGEEPERKVMWRFNCTTYSNGTIKYRLGVRG